MTIAPGGQSPPRGERVEPSPSVRVSVPTPADRPRWDAFVVGRREADVLQTWAWSEADAGERWLRLIAEDAGGRVRGVVQVHVRAGPFGRRILYAPHGPVWDRDEDDADAVLDALLSALRHLGERERGVVLKLDPRGEGGRAEALTTRLNAAGLRRAHHDLQATTTRVVELLDGRDALMKTWGSDARNLVRRSRREGVTVETDRAGSPDAIAAFHELLTVTAARAGFRIRSRRFLEALALELAPTDGWRLTLARFEERPIAGAVAPVIGGRAYYLYAASLRDPALKHKYGAYAAMAELMAEVADAGASTIDLWGVREPGDDTVGPEWEGFSSFKRGFGGQPLRHPGTFDMVVHPFWYRVRDARERIRDRLRARTAA